MSIVELSVVKLETEDFIYHYASTAQVSQALQGLGNSHTQMMRMANIIKDKRTGDYVKHRVLGHETANLIKNMSQADIDHIRNN